MVYPTFVAHICSDFESGVQHLVLQGSVPDWISRGVITLLKNDKHGGLDLDDFRPITQS